MFCRAVLALQRSWVAGLNNNMMRTVQKYFIPPYDLCSQLTNFFPNTVDCLDFFWHNGKVRKGIRVLRESKPHDGRNQRSLWVLQLLSFVNLFFIRFCYFYNKCPILSLGLLHSTAGGGALGAGFSFLCYQYSWGQYQSKPNSVKRHAFNRPVSKYFRVKNFHINFHKCIWHHAFKLKKVLGELHMVCINLNRLYSQGKICDLSKHSKYFRVQFSW